MAIGLLTIRSALGVAMLLQGATKLTRQGRRGTAEYFDGIGLRPAAPLAVLAGATEAGAGALLAVGLATPLAAAALVAVLLSAVAVKSGNGYWNTGDGVEYPLLAMLVAASTAFTGAGELSVDELLGRADASTLVGIAAVAVGFAAAVPLLVRRSMVLRARPAAPALQVEGV